MVYCPEAPPHCFYCTAASVCTGIVMSVPNAVVRGALFQDYSVSLVQMIKMALRKLSTAFLFGLAKEKPKPEK